LISHNLPSGSHDRLNAILPFTLCFDNTNRLFINKENVIGRTYVCAIFGYSNTTRGIQINVLSSSGQSSQTLSVACQFRHAQVVPDFGLPMQSIY
jgi:hypothetical protein